MPKLSRRTDHEQRRPQKITLGEMRASGVRGLLIYCSDYQCSHWVAISGDQWLDCVCLSDLEPSFVCKARGAKGADIRPDFDWVKVSKARAALKDKKKPAPVLWRRLRPN